MSLKYMKQLDGLRAFAVFAVLYVHYLPDKKYWLFGINWGDFAVRLFFVLSGFLITGILLKCRQYVTSGQQTPLLVLRQFYIRRFLRIFPLFYLTLAVAAVINISPVRETIYWHILYLSNFYVAYLGSWPGSVSHLWSIAVEEQFYLIWPWLIIFVSKKMLLPTILSLIIIGPLFRLAGGAFGLNDFAIHTLTPGVIDTLGFGALLAYLKYRGESNITKIFTNSCILIGFPLLVFIEYLNYKDNSSIVASIFHDTALGLTFTWLIAQAARGFRGIIGKILEFSPIVYLGKISYGIYVIHLFVRIGFDKLIQDSSLSAYIPHWSLIILFYTGVTVILAVISWHIFEKPINELKKFFPYIDND
jgi:peptidoglycan/LPS O-acetylase OafA/YrhL